MRHLCLLLMVLLAGCAAQTHQPPPAAQQLPWEQRLLSLAPLNAWELEGKIAIRVDDSNNAAHLSWTQRGDHYRIFMAGPLGRGAVDIEGEPNHLRLVIGGDERYETDTPETLLQQRLGWSFPLSQLSWWVRGLPAPDSPHQLTLDAAQRLSELRQSGWLIRYPQYRLFEGVELPAKLILTRGDNLKLTLLLKRWQFSAAEA